VKKFPKDGQSLRLLAKAMATLLRLEPAQTVRQKAVAAIQKGGVDPVTVLPLLAAELRALGANTQAAALEGS